jgi:Cu-Zn family superoxide dismutase
VITFSTDV